MLYRAEYDTKDDIEINDLWSYISEENKNPVPSSYWEPGGTMFDVNGGDHYRLLLDSDFSEKKTDDSIIVWEARIKNGTLYGGTTEINGTRCFSSNFPLFGAGAPDNDTGLRIYGNGGYFAYSAVQGVRPSEKMSDYLLKLDEFYTYKIKWNVKSNIAQFSVFNETQGLYETDWVNCKGAGNINLKNVICCGSLYFYSTHLDYVHVYDEAAIPKPTFINSDLLNVKSGDKLTVKFPFAVTAQMLEAAPITITNNASLSTVLSSDGMSAEISINNISPREKYTLDIPALGQNKDVRAYLRGKDEAKYYYRAEFDGNDDERKLYVDNINNGSYDSVTSMIKNGSVVMNGNYWSRFCIVFNKLNASIPDSEFKNGIVPSQSIDCTGKENVVFETKMKFGEGKIFSRFMTIGENMVTLGYSDGLMYSTDYVSPNKYFKVNNVNYKISSNVWYTFQVRMNFVTNRYTISVVDENGDFATSGAIGFINNTCDGTIETVTYPAMYGSDYGGLTVDYARLWDDDYGAVNVTYDKAGKKVSLENSVLVAGDETFSFERAVTGGDVSAITAETADGTNLCVNASAQGNTVSFNITDPIAPDTKVNLTIPKEINNADKDQIISFRTKWNTAVEEFVKPEMFKDKTGLNVVFFGGSITAQDGWRVTTTNEIKKWFPDSNCYNSSRGGTGSKYGWTRLENDVKAYDPDVVFVEYAVNDANDSSALEYMESIVRTINTWEKVPVVIFVYTTSVDFKANAYAAAQHTKVADAYGIPVISARDYCMSMYNSDSSFKTDWDGKVYLPDNTHTSAAGGKLYGDYVNALLMANPQNYFKLPKPNSEVSKLNENAREYMYSYTPKVMTLNADAPTTTVIFAGDELVIEVYKTAQSGNMNIDVDGSEIANVSLYAGNSMPSNTFYYYSGFGEGAHIATITAQNGSGGNEINLKGYYQMPSVSSYENPVFSTASITSGVPVEITFSYVTNNSEDVTFIAVSYNSLGAVIGFTPVTTTTEASFSEQISKLTVTPDSNVSKIKAFAWRGYDSMKPLCDYVSISK